MISDIVLPRLGSATMTSATVLQWLVDVGTQVTVDQPIAEVETDKSVIEVPSPARGTIVDLVVPAGEEVVVGGIIARVDDEMPSPRANEVPAPGVQPATTSVNSAAPSAPEGAVRARVPAHESRSGRDHVTVPSTDASAPAELGGRKRSSPLARRRARLLGVDLESVAGSGPHNRVQARDVEAVAWTQPAPEVEGLAGLTGVRRITAARMAQAARQTAPVTLTRLVDVTDLVATARQLREAFDDEVIPTVADLLIVAVGRSLARCPDVNVSLDAGQLVRHGDVNIGYAVHTDRGLRVPVIRGVDRLGIMELARERRALLDRALSGRNRPEDMDDGRFTITNLGSFGIDIFTPIVNLPEAAILGVGRAVDAVVPHEGQVAIRTMMWLSLTFDHRLMDGVPAARFLDDIAQRLGRPAQLLLPADVAGRLT